MVLSGPIVVRASLWQPRKVEFAPPKYREYFAIVTPQQGTPAEVLGWNGDCYRCKFRELRQGVAWLSLFSAEQGFSLAVTGNGIGWNRE